MTVVNHIWDDRGSARDGGELWRRAVDDMIRFGSRRRSSRDGDVAAEILGVRLVLRQADRAWDFVSRRPSPLYAAGELMWYLSGADDGAQIRHYAPAYSRFLNAVGKAHGAYGPRWRAGVDPLALIRDILSTDRGTRQAFLPTFQALDLFAAYRGNCLDVPCTGTLQFIERDDALHTFATMRSNDVWTGLPYDSWCFATLGVLLADDLGIRSGFYIHQAGSLHMYERHARVVENARLASSGAPPDEYVAWWERRREGMLMGDLNAATMLERSFREQPDFSLDSALGAAESQFGERSRLGTVVMLCHANGREYSEKDWATWSVAAPPPVLELARHWQEKQARRRKKS